VVTVPFCVRVQISHSARFSPASRYFRTTLPPAVTTSPGSVGAVNRTLTLRTFASPTQSVRSCAAKAIASMPWAITPLGIPALRANSSSVCSRL
jgi:hypothetical protein